MKTTLSSTNLLSVCAMRTAVAPTDCRRPWHPLTPAGTRCPAAIAPTKSFEHFSSDFFGSSLQFPKKWYLCTAYGSPPPAANVAGGDGAKMGTQCESATLADAVSPLLRRANMSLGGYDE